MRTLIFDQNGIDEYGFDQNGYDEYGYDEDGYDGDGYDEDGYDEDGYSSATVDENRYTYQQRKLEEHEILDNTRYFGEFRCVCRRSWFSSNTWKNSYQKCQKCQKKTYPHTQVNSLSLSGI